MSWSCQRSLMSLITGNKVKKTHKPKTIRGKTFINIWITKVKLFWKKRGAGVLTLQCNSYLSHVRPFFKISSNFLSLISSYPLLKMFFSTLSFLWTTAVGPCQNNLTFVIQMLINVFPRIVFVRTFFLHISRESNDIYCFCLIIFVLIY
jgi:hypothetical protein